MKLPHLIFSTGILLFGLVGLTNAQVLNVGPGDVIEDGTVIESGTTVNVIGGIIETNVDLSDGVLNIESGSVALGAFGTMGTGSGFTNLRNLVNLRGGTVGGFFQLMETEFNIFGGTIESFGLFDDDTIVNITGGEVTRFPDIFAGRVNISGGDVFAIRLFEGGTVNFIGTDFILDGNAISLDAGESLEITARNQILSGTFADGSAFSYDLTDTIGGFSSAEPGGFAVDGTLLITAVPEPTGMMLLGAIGMLAVARRRKD